MKTGKTRKWKGTTAESPVGPPQEAGVEVPVEEGGGNPEPAEEADRKSRGKNSGGSQLILLILGVAILSLMVIGCAFALGYYMGGQNEVINKLAEPKAREDFQQRGPWPRNDTGERRGPAPEKGGEGTGDATGRFRMLLEDEQTDLIKGSITSADGESVTVQTPHGDEVASLTEETGYFLPHGSPGAGGEEGVKPGEQVLMIVRQSDSSRKAVAVRVLDWKKND